jgi:ATP-dependent Clp protease ATP-binding subunit ClpC
MIMMGLADFNLTPKAKKGLKDSKKFARDNGHNLVTTAHLVYGCLSNLSDTCSLRLLSYDINLDAELFKGIFKKYVNQNEDYFLSKKGQGGWHEDVSETIRSAKDFSDMFDSYFIGIEHVLYVVLDEDDMFVKFLSQNGIDVMLLKDLLEEYLSEDVRLGQIRHSFGDEAEDFINHKGVEEELPQISKYCINLNEEFGLKGGFTISGRDKEISQLVEVLSKKNKSNAILVGDAGVGKTAIAEGLAQKIVSQEVPTHMSLMQICSVDISAMVAGSKYRGEFEEKFKALIHEAENHPHIILFFDEIHTIIGAGNSQGAVDASNMLKPALARGNIKCIGATTTQEYKKYFEKDTAMKRRFDKIQVEEPSKGATKDIVMKTISYYEEFHNVNYSEANIDTIIEFSEKYLSNRKFPDKAFDIIDQLGARTRIKYSKTPEDVQSVRSSFYNFVTEDNDEELNEEKFTSLLKEYLQSISRCQENRGRKQKIRQKDILAIFQEKTGLSPKAISEKDSSFTSFSKKMNSEVFGQEKNIEIINNTLSCSKAGLNDPKKPLGNFLFIGATSVGKTYTAKNIAKHFFGNEKSLLQLNMSEYQDKTAISKLIGANAGYVGYDEGGLLTEFVRDNPNSVILFDEVEKCEPKVLDVLLHILDEGYATDNLNRKIDFTKTVIIMTSNVGHKEKSKNSMGFAPTKQNEKEVYNDSVKKHFRPELLARVDEVVIFNELGEHELKLIIRKELKEIKERLEVREIKVVFKKNLEIHVFNKIKNDKNHARQIKNVVKSLIQVPISNFIIKNRDIKEISINVVDKSLEFA